MCNAAFKNGMFDMDSCPLLAGLSPEERRRRIEDPDIQACMARFGQSDGAPAAERADASLDEPYCVAAARAGQDRAATAGAARA